MTERYIYNPVADAPMPPGELIREILEDRGMTQADFATRMGRSQKFVSQLVNGKASLSYETAIELERVLGVASAVWNNWESTYRDALARAESVKHVAEQSEWAKSFPLKEMAAANMIARESSVAEQTEALFAFFGVASVDAHIDYWGSDKRLAARMSQAFTPETSALTAWLRAGELAAEKIETEPFSAQEFRSLLDDLRSATRLAPNEWLPLMIDGCAKAGVAVVFVHDLPKTRCHGVSWWANRNRAVIQLGLRFKRDDQVWFSFFHEAAHLLLCDRGSGISDLNGDTEIEARADRFASELLIPPADYQEFISAGRPSRADVEAFALRLGIAASIVVGRLQHDHVVPQSWFRELVTTLKWEEPPRT